MKVLLFVTLVYICAKNVVEAIPIKHEDILKSYGGFSHVLLKEKYRRGVGETDVPASSYSTFGIGYLLAVLHEKVWDLDTRGFNLALKTPYNRISASYIALLNLISEDDDVAVFSDIYTSRENVKFPKSDALRTQITFTNYNGTVADVDTASAEINARVALQTYGKIYGKPVPEVGWWGAPFYNYTQGIFTNTYHFGSRLANPIMGVFDAEYEATDYSTTNQSRKTKFLETTGYLVSSADADHSAVRIPFTNGNKSLVLVLPNDKISKFVKYELDEYFKPTSSNVSNLPLVRIWIPPLNLTLPNQHNELQKMGITEAVCRYDKRLENVIESIVQYTHISLNEDQYFSVAAVTATHLNNVKEFIEIQTNGTEPSVSQEDDNEGRSDLFNAMKTRVVGAGGNRESKVSSEMKDSYETHDATASQTKTNPRLPDDLSTSSTTNTNDQETVSTSSNLIKFNRPFFFFLDDVHSGPVFFGSVDSFEKLTKPVPETVPEGFEWLHDAQKYLLWSCP